MSYFQRVEELLTEVLDILSTIQNSHSFNKRFDNLNEIWNHYPDLTEVTTVEIVNNPEVQITCKDTKMARYKAVQRALALYKESIKND